MKRPIPLLLCLLSGIAVGVLFGGMHQRLHHVAAANEARRVDDDVRKQWIIAYIGLLENGQYNELRSLLTKQLDTFGGGPDAATRSAQ